MIRLLRLCQRGLPFEDRGRDLVHLAVLDDRLGERLDVADHIAEIADAIGAVRLKGRLARERDHRMHEGLGNGRAAFNGAQMAVVLADRVGKRVLDRLGERLDVADHIAEIADALGAVRLECRLARERDHRMHEGPPRHCVHTFESLSQKIHPL